MFNILRRNSPIDLEWIARQEEPVRHTPDIWRLGRCPTWRLFVYGEELWTLPITGNNLGRAYTKDPFTLWKCRASEATWPFALDKECTDFPWAKDLLIQGQLWEVPTNMLVTLDNYYENTVKFERRRIRIHFPYMRTNWTRSLGILKEEFDVDEYVCFMYIGRSSYFLPELVNQFNKPVRKAPKQTYDLVRSAKPRSPYLQDYYYFSYLEYEPVDPFKVTVPNMFE